MQQQLTAVQQQQGVQQQQLTAVQQQQGVMQQQLTALQQQQGVMLHRSSASLVTARLCNSHATQDAHKLTPLPHPDTGAAPPIFPRHVRAFRHYTNNQCMILINFYGLGVAPAALEARRSLIARHIGCLVV